ncbi:capping protein-inhibiting regulator of actin dynamics isoform X2 [Leucoraja erinacea]|uniref:capping protein-inhibiting regulator of actin dynamics isoform X2 n=1 Tax=Leucoraja erinaceus TaxID=7782 RepID=UPI002455A43D|nr:capping protein-inhibiting regulator of actin dynamics isoform X2 [Leucoraja erinacea]
MSRFYCCLRGSPGDYIMATGLPDTRQTTETEECNEECSGKKKSRFKTFKNFFAKKKRKVADTAKGESSLKPSLSSTDVSTAQPSEVQPDTEIGTQSNIGSRAFSHDSIFIPELSVSEAVPVGGTSQEHTAGRVKALQLEQDIRLPSPSVLITSRKTEDPGMFSEDHGLPRSPLEISSLHAVLRCSTPKSAAPDERQNSLSFGGTESEDEEMIFSIASSRPISPLVPMATTSDSLPVGFSSPASSLTCLDHSAAKHKIAINPRRHKFFAKQTKPANREYSGSPKDKTFNLLERKDEREQVRASGTQQPNEISLELGDSDIQQNKMPCSKFLEMNEEECTEKVQKISRASSDTHLPVHEDIFDGETTNLHGDTLPIPTGHMVLPSETVCNSEDPSDSKEIPSVADLAPGTLPVDEEDSRLSSAEPIADEEQNEALSSCPTQVAVAATPEVSEKKVQYTDLAETNEDPSFLDDEGELVSPNANVPPSLISNLAALPQVDKEKGTISSTPESCLTSKQAKEVPFSDESLDSSKECNGCVDNALTHQSTVEEADAKGILNHRPDHVPKPCDKLTDDIGFISEVPLGDSVKQPDLSTPQVECSQSELELSILDELSQEQQQPNSQGPIKFSVASAWQRSLMDVNRRNVDCSLPTEPKSGCCENTSEVDVKEAFPTQDVEESIRHQQIHNLPLKENPVDNEPAPADNCLQDIVQQAKSEQETKRSPFGVRLRRTSPPYKYSTEVNFKHKEVEGKVAMGVASCLATQSPDLRKGDGGMGEQSEASLTTRNEKDMSKNAAGLLLEGQMDGCPTSRKPESLDTPTERVTREKYHIPRVKNERKNSETSADSANTSERNVQSAKPEPANCPRVKHAEPVWISLARQKQKGFQDQYSTTEEKTHLLEDKSPIPKQETTKHLMKQARDKEPPTSFQNMEMKINKTEDQLPRITAPPMLGPHLQPKPQACGMGIRDKRPISNTKLAPLSTVEPPWLAIAKKKAKAWSDMPQTVQ